MPKLPTLPYSLLWALPNVCLQILPQILPSSTSGSACFLPSRGQNLPDLPPGSSTSGRACFLPSRGQNLPDLPPGSSTSGRACFLPSRGQNLPDLPPGSSTSGRAFFPPSRSQNLLDLRELNFWTGLFPAKQEPTSTFFGPPRIPGKNQPENLPFNRNSYVSDLFCLLLFLEFWWTFTVRIGAAERDSA